MGASSSSSTSVHSMSKGSKLASSVLILRVNGGEEIEFELRLNPQRIAFDELMRAVERDLGKFCKAWLRRSSNIDFADARLALKNAQNKAFHRNSSTHAYVYIYYYVYFELYKYRICRFKYECKFRCHK